MYELAIEEHDDAVAMCRRALLTLEDVERTVEEEERALDYLQRSADKGYANAMGELGLMHHVGWGSFSKDLGRAAMLFKQAIDTGRVTNSMYYLAWIVLDGYDDVPPDPQAAVELLQQAIDEGNDTDAMVFLAKILRDGHQGNKKEGGNAGVIKKDWIRAAELLKRANEAGHTSALYHLACLYLNARDEDEWRKDLTKAEVLLKQAIDTHGDRHAMFKLAVLYKDGYDDNSPNPAKALPYLRRAVDEGAHLHAMLELSLLYRHGADGIDINHKEADKLLRTVDARIQTGPHEIDVTAANLLEYASERGDDKCADALVGIHYKFGDEPFGLDKPKALKLLRRAADAGESDAMFHLGMMVMDGVEGEQEPDMCMAMRLFHEAADKHSNLAAINVLASFLLEGYREIDADVEQAVMYLQKAIELGDTHSMNRLAMLYVEGDLVPQGRDMEKARDLFERAAEKEDVHALHNLAVLVRNGRKMGEGKERKADMERARELLQRAIDRRRHFRSMIGMADLLLLSCETGGEEENVRQRRREAAAQLVEDAVEMGDLDAGNLHTALRNGGYEEEDKDNDEISSSRHGAAPEDEDDFDDDDDDEDEDVDSVDYSRRATMFRLAIMNNDNPVAFYSLACLVQESQADVCADAHAAARWFQRAVDCDRPAMRAHGLAAVGLATMLLPRNEEDQGDDDDELEVDVDVDRARSVLIVAAQQGCEEAQDLLDTIV